VDHRTLLLAVSPSEQAIDITIDTASFADRMVVVRLKQLIVFDTRI
jgi:hypothetical protein